MVEVISSAFVIALVVNSLLQMPGYKYLKKYGRPLNCVFCMCFWISVIIGVFNLHSLTTLQMLFVTLSTPFLGLLIERVKDALPIKIS